MSAILVVDDSSLVRGMMRNFLEGLGHEVLVAQDGLEGVLTAYKRLPDLIITDVEMPRLRGYQLSRLLKSRREICKIPIIMHTSLSEDRDKFWASSSGADSFITKDFDSVEALSGEIDRLLAAAAPFDRSIAAEDAAGIDEIAVLEMLGELFDRELFQSTILNELGATERRIGSLKDSVADMLSILGKVCQAHIAVLVVRYENDARAFILPSAVLSGSEIDTFAAMCLRDFSRLAGSLRGTVSTELIGDGEGGDSASAGDGSRRISSYHLSPLSGKGDSLIGTLHIGNFSNNYFSGTLVEHLGVFARGASTILENAVLFNTANDMRRKITTIFSKFVPMEVIQELLSKRDDTDMKVGEKRNVAILFADIRRFTAISENNPADKIVIFLNRYFQLMVDIIRAEGGTIDKFIGDAILAIFGAPVSHEDNAARAVRAAIAMSKALGNFDTGGLVLPKGGLRIGIGIHEGDVIVGNIGSQDKFDYTVIGDNVNLASRLEGLTKHYRASVILSDVVAKAVESSIGLREIDMVRVLGKEQATVLYSVPSAEASPLDEADAESYRKGLSMYRMGNWTTARDYFVLVLEHRPDDPLSRMYLERCTEFLAQPPSPDWDGAIRLDFK